jgi:hypothetical protein
VGACLQETEMTRREKILEVFHKHGGMTQDALLTNFGLFGCIRSYELRAELQTLVNYGKLRMLGNVYFPTKQPAKEAKVMEVVPPRYQPAFKQLNTFLPKISPRGQAIENRTFHTCSSNIRETGKN